MYDGAAAATAAAATQPHTDAPATDAAHPDAGSGASSSSPTAPASSADHTATPAATAPAAAAPPAGTSNPAANNTAAPVPVGPAAAADAGSGTPGSTPTAGQQIVFIDGNVPDAQSLVAGVKPGIQVVILDPNGNGVQQMADYLSSHDEHNLDAIQIVSHGEDATVRLGNTILGLADISMFSPQLATIGQALKPGGDILFYGCNVGEGFAGTLFEIQISRRPAARMSPPRVGWSALRRWAAAGRSTSPTARSRSATRSRRRRSASTATS